MAKINFSQIKETLDTVKAEIHRGIVGQEDMIQGLLLAMLANGHVLIEGVPGLAKTRAVNLLSKISGLKFQRLQFTPDLLPADVVGTRIYNQSTSSFETRKGPVFANFLLVDEINRAPAKVQSALLECMQEKQVTIGEETFTLPPPFLVFATQNPVEQEGTYPLPEAQVDRFLLKLVMDYPTQEEEQDIVRMVIQETKLPDVNRVLSGEKILMLQGSVREVHIEDKLIEYITDIVFATRKPENYELDVKESIAYGASPRASIYIAQVSRATAILNSRDHVLPDDIKSSVIPVMRHRVIMSYHAEAEGITSEQIINQILSTIPVP